MIFYFFGFQSWDSFFRSTTAGAQPGAAYQAPPSLARNPNQVELSEVMRSPRPVDDRPQMATSDKSANDHMNVMAIIRSYQVYEKNRTENTFL